MSYAVAFTTYAWNEFVARQYDRVRARVRSEDLYVVADEGGGQLTQLALQRVTRTSAADIEARLELLPIVEVGPWGRQPVLWWNLDYLSYRFFSDHGEYDYCLTMDFDACLNLDVDKFVSEAAAERLDLVAFPHDDLQSWYWAKPHAELYPAEILRACLLSVMLISRSAASYLMRRRREMGLAYRQGAVPFWPFCEAFMPTELARAGFRLGDLRSFGATDHYQYRPALDERDIDILELGGFVDPVRPAIYARSRSRQLDCTR